MHGVKRVAEKPVLSEAEKQKKLQQIAKYNRLKTQALQAHQKKEYNDDTYNLTAKLISLNPDFYTLWNIRKEIVLHFFEIGRDKKQICSEELKLTEVALKHNPKSYGAWHHRLWTIDQRASDLQEELKLCNLYLKADSRNFHCWDYRRYVVHRMQAQGLISPKNEFDFTTEKIKEDFSNFSAWHYRSSLIPKIFENAPVDELHKMLDTEFKLVENAFYVNPNDQSPWLYHRWLLSFYFRPATTSLSTLGVLHAGPLHQQPSADSKQELSPAATVQQASQTSDVQKRCIEVLWRELRVVEALLQIEPSSKWALLTSAVIMDGLVGSGEKVEQYSDKIKATFEKLLALDPDRRNYYQSVRKKLK